MAATVYRYFICDTRMQVFRLVGWLVGNMGYLGLFYAKVSLHFFNHWYQFDIIFYLMIIFCLHLVIGFQVFLSNTDNFQTDLNFLVRVDLGVIGMKVCVTLLRAPELEPHHTMLFNVIPRTPDKHLYVAVYLW